MNNHFSSDSKEDDSLLFFAVVGPSDSHLFWDLNLKP